MVFYYLELFKMKKKRINFIFNKKIFKFSNIWGIFTKKINKEFFLYDNKIYFFKNFNYIKFLKKIKNLIYIYNNGWYIRLKFQGFGYKYKIFKQKIRVYLGFCHNIDFWFSNSFICLKEKRYKTQILLYSFNIYQMKYVIKILKNFRFLNPYKFLGILYTNQKEHIKSKQGKAQFK